MIDCVIPARNEAATIGPVISVLKSHPRIGNVIVSVDAETTDDTATIAKNAGADIVVFSPEHGKGQTVLCGLKNVTTEHVMFCDADIVGLTSKHLDDMLRYVGRSVVLGIPDIPDSVNERVRAAWPGRTGQRIVPMWLIDNLPLHGYLMEVQINRAAIQNNVPFYQVPLAGLVARFLITPKRHHESWLDRQWIRGQKNRDGST